MVLHSQEPVDTARAARLVGLSASMLETLRHKGGGPRYIKLGRKVVYDPSDIREWLEARKVASTSQQVAA